jgi:hypothetical protein
MAFIVTHIDASSAILAYTNSIPQTFTMKPQNKFGKPPVKRVNLNSTKRTSQLAITVLAKPSMVTNLKFRCNVAQLTDLERQSSQILLLSALASSLAWPCLVGQLHKSVHMAIMSKAMYNLYLRNLDTWLVLTRPPRILSSLLDRAAWWPGRLAFRSPLLK